VATNSTGCNCQRIIFSSQNAVAVAKHANSYGEYFLYGAYEGAPVYQHFAGVEFLYRVSHCTKSLLLKSKAG
jgi:hypothetical protein